MLNRPCPEEHHGIRDLALLELAYSAGLRRKELVGLEVGDVDLTGGFLKIREGKGGKERVVPLGHKAKEALERYLQVTRPRLQMRKKQETSRLFLTERGAPIKSTTVEEIIVKYRPHHRIHTHTLRHACALHMLKGGADVRYIQELLGHASPNTTMLYTRLLPADLLQMHHRYHPRERMHDSAKA